MKSKIFYQLERLRNSGFPNFGDNAYSEPMDNIGERIEEEFKKRPLQEEEKEIATEYFTENYVRSLRAAKRYAQALERTVPSSVGFKIILNKSRNFLKRALNSELRSKKVCNESVGMMIEKSEEEIKNDLKNLEHELYMVQEFPQTFKDVAKYHKGKSEAIEREEYMLAGFFNKQIHKISDLETDYQNDLSLEYTGDED